MTVKFLSGQDVDIPRFMYLKAFLGRGIIVESKESAKLFFYLAIAVY